MQLVDAELVLRLVTLARRGNRRETLQAGNNEVLIIISLQMTHATTDFFAVIARRGRV